MKVLWITLCVAFCVAAVFVRQGSSAGLRIEALGGARVSAEEIRVNGQAGQMEIYGFDRDYARAWAFLAEACSATNATATLTWDENTRLIGLATGVSPGGLVAVISGDLSNGTASWPWSDIAQPADVTWSLAIEMRQGRTAMVTGATPDTPLAFKDQMTAHLAKAGWSAISPASATTGVTLFARRSETLLVAAFPKDGHASVLLLRRL